MADDKKSAPSGGGIDNDHKKFTKLEEAAKMFAD